MERYSYTKEQRTQIEQLRVPMGIYQLVDGKVIPVALSAGFCELFGYPSLAEAYRNMNHEMYRDVHPDDAGRISNIAVQFAESTKLFFAGGRRGQTGIRSFMLSGNISGQTTVHGWRKSGTWMREPIRNRLKKTT